MAQLRNASEEFKRTWESEIEREAIKDQQRQAANSTAPTNTVPQEAAATNTEAAATNPYETIPPEPESAQAHPPWESAQAPAFLKEASIKDSSLDEASSSAVPSTVSSTVPNTVPAEISSKIETEDKRPVPIA